MKKGFTLIEVLIYISLVSLMITGVIVSTYELLDGGAWLEKRVNGLEEGHFALRKIEWLMRQSDDILVPAAFGTSTELILGNDDWEAKIYVIEGRMWLSEDGESDGGRDNMADDIFLTGSRARVDSIEFSRKEENGIESFHFSFSLDDVFFEKTIWLK